MAGPAVTPGPAQGRGPTPPGGVAWASWMPFGLRLQGLGTQIPEGTSCPPPGPATAPGVTVTLSSAGSLLAPPATCLSRTLSSCDLGEPDRWRWWQGRGSQGCSLGVPFTWEGGHPEMTSGL